MEKSYDLAVVGAGPGGYVAAIRGVQLQQKVLLLERDKVGGTCMNWGCIPTKYLLHQTKIFQSLKKNQNIEGPLSKLRYNWEGIQAEKEKKVMRLVKGIEFLLKKNGVDVVKGAAFLKADNQLEIRERDRQHIATADKIILAMGSSPAELPMLKSDGQYVINSREALELKDIPKKLLIVGAGAIGLEIGTIYLRMGCDVTILEILPQVLPGSDIELTKRLERILKLTGLQVYTQMRIEESFVQNRQVFLKGTCLKNDTSFEYSADKVLLAVGRKPVSEGLKQTPVNMNKAGFVEVSPHLETNCPGIYAIGDLIGGKLLAHKASHEGIMAVENALGLNKRMNYQALPLAVFTEPEFSSVGLTEMEAKASTDKIKVGVFSLQANGRALTLGEQEGLVKVVADAKEKIIGAHILAPNASELIAEMTLAIAKEMTLKDIASLIHIHPTLSEALMEAALKARNEAIHMLNNPQ